MAHISFGAMTTETGVWFDTFEEAAQYVDDYLKAEEAVGHYSVQRWNIMIVAYAFAQRICTFSFHPSYGWWAGGFVRDGVDLVAKYGLEKELGRA